MPHMYRANEEKWLYARGHPTLAVRQWLPRILGTQQPTSQQNAATFRLFYKWITGGNSLTSLAKEHNLTRHTLHARMKWCWLIQPAVEIDRDRVYDQLFIDGTYLTKRCLLIAASLEHVVDWLWCDKESTDNYIKLLSQLQAPLIITLDGGNGAYSAIKQCWPTSRIQRCTVHVQRHIRRKTTSRPRTDAGQAIYALVLALTKVTNKDQAHDWSENWSKHMSSINPPLGRKPSIGKVNTPKGGRGTGPTSATGPL